MNPMTNIHSWAPEPAEPLHLMSWEALAGRNPPFRANISCFYDASSKALLVKLPIFLTNLNISWLFDSPVSFLETLWGGEDTAPTLDALDTGTSILHRLISLHCRAQAELQKHRGNLSHKIQCLLACKEKHISSQHNIWQAFLSNNCTSTDTGELLRRMTEKKGSSREEKLQSLSMAGRDEPAATARTGFGEWPVHHLNHSLHLPLSPASFCLGALW